MLDGRRVLQCVEMIESNSDWRDDVDKERVQMTLVTWVWRFVNFHNIHALEGPTLRNFVYSCKGTTLIIKHVYDISRLRSLRHTALDGVNFKEACGSLRSRES